MSLRKSPRISPAFLAANRDNAKKSTGPRTALGKARVSMNGLKHGLRSHLSLSLMAKLGEPVDKCERMIYLLFSALKPQKKPEVARVVRYARMLWAINRRMNKHRCPMKRRAGLLALSKAERSLQNRIVADLGRARAQATYRERRKPNPVFGFIRILDLMPDAGAGKLKNDGLSRNVL